MLTIPYSWVMIGTPEFIQKQLSGLQIRGDGWYKHNDQFGLVRQISSGQTIYRIEFYLSDPRSEFKKMLELPEM